MVHPYKKKKSFRIPFVMTYNRTLPPLAAIFRKHWSLLSLNQKLEDAFDEYPVMAYKRRRNLKDYLGSNTIENDKDQSIRKSTAVASPVLAIQTLCVASRLSQQTLSEVIPPKKATRFSIILTARASMLST